MFVLSANRKAAELNHYSNSSNNSHSCFNYLGTFDEFVGSRDSEEIIKWVLIEQVDSISFHLNPQKI